MRTLRASLLLLIVLAFLFPSSALAQNYSFSLDSQTVHVFWNEDGTMAIDYVFVFTNDPSASPIDFVDVGLPTDDYDLQNITAEVNGQPVEEIEPSPYVIPGVAINLGSGAIQPGQTGEVHVFVPRVERVLFLDEQDPNYVSGLFSPTWFDSQFVHGSTEISVTFHFPPGVQPEEPRWHAAPAGFPDEPETGFDGQDRVVYTWRNPDASGDEQYIFGASFPKQYIPEEAIQEVFEPVQGAPAGSTGESGISFGGDFTGVLCCFGFGGLFVLFGLISASSSQRRKLQYLPPKISIEGHGIKRGLTAVEAAILLEEPLDKILTMTLFSAIKKNAATVISREPLKVQAAEPLPEGLQPYESEFLRAMSIEKKTDQRKALQDLMIDLVNTVAQKMKGFSRKETVAYYRDIMRKAWAQVEAAGTPEVKSQKFDENLEWTMLDEDYDRRTRDVFRTGPVYVPVWWPRYDPGYGRSIPGGTTSAPSTTPSIPTSEGGGGINMPTLPGSAFAGSVVTGVQDFATGVVGNISDFTKAVTNKTNPVPVVSTTTSSRRSGGGCACACACACAGCACACAGGGR
jgi:hypothetical protein